MHGKTLGTCIPSDLEIVQPRTQGLCAVQRLWYGNRTRASEPRKGPGYEVGKSVQCSSHLEFAFFKCSSIISVVKLLRKQNNLQILDMFPQKETLTDLTDGKESGIYDHPLQAITKLKGFKIASLNINSLKSYGYG